MGLFKKRPSLKERTKEKYYAKSLKELSDFIGRGLKNKNELSVEERFGIADVYIEKLIAGDPADGGFGYENDAEAIKVAALTTKFANSVYENGIYSRINSFGQKVIMNYHLAFLKNYLRNGNRKQILSDWAVLIFNDYEITVEENGKEFEDVSPENLVDRNCSLFNPWVYQGNDNDFILYKIKLARCFCNDNFVNRYGLVKGGKNAGKTLQGDGMGERVTFDDLTKFNNKQDIDYFLVDCQTIDN